MTGKLFQVKFEVRPSYEHPRYHHVDLKLSILIIWLHGKDGYDAENRAFEILKLLPYELVGADSKTCISDENTEDTDWKKYAANEARTLGFALCWMILEAGKLEG